MRPIIILSGIMLIIGMGCHRDPQGSMPLTGAGTASISGRLTNGEDHLVTIDLMGATAFVPLDSVRCDSKGAFEFTIPCEQMNFYALKYTESGYLTLIVNPGDGINISGSAESLHPYSLEGSTGSLLVRELSIEHKRVLDELSRISWLSQEYRGAQDYARMKEELNARFDSITRSFHSFSVEFIRKNAASPAILFALYNLYGPGLPVFELPADMAVFDLVDSSLYKLYPENEAIKLLHTQLAGTREQLAMNAKKPGISTGMSAPDFVMTTGKGTMLSLSDLRGQYVLLQFWASWSVMSMDENAFLKSCYNKFSGSGFTILQVSIDSEKESWLKTIHQQQLNWNHVSDLTRWESAAVNLYQIDRIPANFLIDPEGRIVARDLFGEELIETIGKYIK